MDADPVVKRRNPRVELGQRRIGQPPHRSQRVLRRDARLDVDVREQRPTRPILAPHRSHPESLMTSLSESDENNKHQRIFGRLFQQPASF
jgi:hypothetical protein